MEVQNRGLIGQSNLILYTVNLTHTITVVTMPEERDMASNACILKSIANEYYTCRQSPWRHQSNHTPLTVKIIFRHDEMLKTLHFVAKIPSKFQNLCGRQTAQDKKGTI